MGRKGVSMRYTVSLHSAKALHRIMNKQTNKQGAESFPGCNLFFSYLNELLLDVLSADLF